MFIIQFSFNKKIKKNKNTIIKTGDDIIIKLPDAAVVHPTEVHPTPAKTPEPPAAAAVVPEANPAAPALWAPGFKYGNFLLHQNCTL